jgi:hypothetical protein
VKTENSKVFTHKLIALFLSVLMVLSSFTGALTAFAESSQTDKDYHDGNLASNFMAWAETTDEQTAEALLDYADLYLSDLMTGLLGSDHISFSQSIVVDTISIDGYLDSVDGIYDLIRQVQKILSSYGSIVGGDVKNIDLTPISGLTAATSGDSVVSKCGKSYRQNYSAKELIMALAKVLYINSNDFAGKNVIGNFFKGTLDIGTILTKVLGDDVYGLLQDTFDMWDGYEGDVVYNLVANIIIKNTKWFTEDEISTYYADLKKTSGSRTYAWNFDDVLFKALSEQLLQKINVQVTYSNMIATEENGKTVYVNDSSKLRKEENRVQDSKLVYSSETGYEDNVLLFQYDYDGDGTIKNTYDEDGNILVEEKLEISKTDNLFSFAFRAFKLAWNTVLKDTLGTVHANYDVDRGNGANFDNEFFYWLSTTKGWDYDDWTSNYSAANVEAWAEAEYEEYTCASADEFLANVKHTFEYDRSVVDDAKGNWQDIDSKTIVNKLRYNPLADLYFDMQTGPINLYFEQTGIDSITEFFDTAFTKYSNLVAGLNDALVAVTKVIFVNSDNVGYGTTEDNKPETNLTVPEMATTGNTIDTSTIASTLVTNALSMFEYAANAADANILNAYYTNNSIDISSVNETGRLTESNFEEAMIPLLVACLNTDNLSDLTGMIHDEKWDSAKDAEGVAIVVLEEYLSYVLPDKDYSSLWTYDNDGYIVANSDQTLFDNAVLPMVRDALGYVISSTVPCRDKSGNEWDVYESDPTTDETTIFDILNSVICYYASTDDFKDGTVGKAVASLLGVVDENGKCLVSMDNTIWKNLDNVVNNILPIVGTLQYGTTDKAGKASTEELIYDDIIGGVLDIGAVNKHTNKQGITTILEEILTIITADPISKQGVDCMVYDNVVASLANNLFGARYTGQGYDKVIPYSSYYDKDSYDNTHSDSPFDSLVTANTLAYYSASNDTDDGESTGIIGILICNIYEAFGGSTYDNDGTDGCWQGAMFAVKAVNNFIPSFVPELSDHQLNAATAELSIPSESVTSGNDITTTALQITNNSIGLNRFYRDENGDVQQDDRYFINVTDVSVTADGDTNIQLNMADATGVIAPEKFKSVSITGKGPSESTLYTFTITYDVFLGKMNGTSLPTAPATKDCLYQKLQTQAYLYITPDADWKGTLYSRDYTNDTSLRMYAAAYEVGYSSTSDYTTSTAPGGTSYGRTVNSGKGDLYATLPNDFIVPMSDPSSIENLTFRVRNAGGSTFGTDRAFDGIYTYLTSGTTYYPVTDKLVSDTEVTATADNSAYAYAAIDKATGNILNYDLYDYYDPTYDNGDGTKGAWMRGTVQGTGVYSGYTATEIGNLSESITKAVGYQTRTHVAYTFDEALALGYVAGVQRTAAAADSSGNITYSYEAVLINLTAARNVKYNDTSVATLLLQGNYADDSKLSISWGTPTAGLYLAAGKTDVGKNSTIYTKFLAYDGETELSADDYSMKVHIYTTNNDTMDGTIHIYIADDTGASTLTNSYNSNLNKIAAYRAADFSDYSTTNKKSDTYDKMIDALTRAVKTVSEPINTSNASSLGSTMIHVASTENSTSKLHKDVAYAPIPTTTSLPATIQAYATKGDDGYWYYNEECTIPVYSNTTLKAAGLTKDPTGAAVELGDDGEYHLVNATVYTTEWDTTTYANGDTLYPYLKDTNEQATNANGEPLYKQISFVYRDENGDKVKSTDDWAYKIAESSTVIKPNDGTTDYRGLYQKEIDNLAYRLEQLQSKVNNSLGNEVLTDVTVDRDGMNNVNYDVASYEKMVQIAKAAEKLASDSTVLEIPQKIEEDESVTLLISELGIKDEDGNIIDKASNLPTNSEIYETVDSDTGKPVYYYISSTTSKASLQIDEAIRLYQEYKTHVYDRGYIGNKLETEITCATTPEYNGTTNTPSGYTYADFTVTDSNVTSATATDAEYGAWVDGTLVNEGETVYSDASWNAYVSALANAVETATAKTAKVSQIYTAKKALQIAENNLTEADADAETTDTITITGKITIATNLDGTDGTSGIIGIDVMLGDQVVATSASDGTFTAVVPVGTTELTLSGPTTIDRTVTLSGTADVKDVVIPICVCDYVKNGAINTYDKNIFFSAFSGEFNVYCDLVVNDTINTYDKNVFYIFFGKTVVYADLSLD